VDLFQLAHELEFAIEQIDTSSEVNRNKTFAQARRQLIDDTIKSLKTEEQKKIREDFDGHGPLDEFINDPEVSEILVQSYKDIWIEKYGQLKFTNKFFFTEKNFYRFVDKICSEANCIVSIERPFADGKWNNLRLHIAAPPATKNSPLLTLRKHPEDSWNLNKLFLNQWCSEDSLHTLKQIIKNKWNFLVVGSTGSGKTSVLNSLLQEMQNERCLVLEDCEEVVLPAHGPSTRLLTRVDNNNMLAEINLNDLLRQAMRMRPDRLLIGEIRGGEAKDYLLALSTGHAGSFGTLHAESAQQALMRLEMLVQMGAPQWSLDTIRRLIHLSLHCIIVLERTTCGKRKLKGIHQLHSLENNGFILEEIGALH
jgi:pilus assembly protein CpaF